MRDGGVCTGVAPSGGAWPGCCSASRGVDLAGRPARERRAAPGQAARLVRDQALQYRPRPRPPRAARCPQAARCPPGSPRRRSRSCRRMRRSCSAPRRARTRRARRSSAPWTAGRAGSACPPRPSPWASPGWPPRPRCGGSGSRRPGTVSCSATGCGRPPTAVASGSATPNPGARSSPWPSWAARCSRSPRGARRAAAASNPPSWSAGRSAAAPGRPSRRSPSAT